MIQKFIFIIIALASLVSIQAQSNIVKIIELKSNGTQEFKLVEIQQSTSVDEVLQEYKHSLIDSNYLEASIDSIIYDSLNQNFHAYLFKGPIYDFNDITLDSIDNEWIEKYGISELNNKDQFLQFRNYLIHSLADNGFPFASVQLVRYNNPPSPIRGYLELNRGPMITVDSIINARKIKLSDKFIYKYLDIAQGSDYNYSKINAIANKLSSLTFLQQYQNPDVTFFGNYATVNLYLQEKNSSRFDFLFGIIPTQNIAGRQLFLSLDVTAELVNKLGNGEYFFIDFERLRPEQQKFEIRFNYPYLLGLNYALDVDFSLFRVGFDFQTISSDIGIEYIINNLDRIKLSWNYESTNIIDIDTSSLLNNKMLPQDLDVSQNGLAVRYSLNRLDYQANPRSGFNFNIKGAAGLRKIQRNTKILTLKNDNVDFSEAYDSLVLNSSRFEIKSSINKYTPIGLRSTILSSLKLGWRFSEEGLYRNEKFQIGGNKLLRGFDEAQFFTSYYSVLTLEHRILLSNNSFFSLPFIDAAYLQNTLEENVWAIGVGSGLGIETKAGVFQFSLAVGRTKEISFDFSRPKAHFGYISVF